MKLILRKAKIISAILICISIIFPGICSDKQALASSGEITIYLENDQGDSFFLEPGGGSGMSGNLTFTNTAGADVKAVDSVLEWTVETWIDENGVFLGSSITEPVNPNSVGLQIGSYTYANNTPTLEDILGNLSEEVIQPNGTIGPISFSITYDDNQMSNRYQGAQFFFRLGLKVAPVTSYTINYYQDELGDGGILLETETISGIGIGETITLDSLTINAYRPASDYEEGLVYVEGVETVLLTIDENPDNNKIDILYKKAPTPTAVSQYAYVVKYYKDSSNDVNFLGAKNGKNYNVGILLADTDIARDINDWLTQYRPVGYSDIGVVDKANSSYTITANASNNIIKVVYKKTTTDSRTDPDDSKDTSTPKPSPNPTSAPVPENKSTPTPAPKTEVKTEVSPEASIQEIETSLTEPEQIPEIEENDTVIVQRSETDENIYYIYDKDGNPLGYILVPEGKTIDDMDLENDLLPFGKANPTTMDKPLPINGAILTVLLLLIAILFKKHLLTILCIPQDSEK